MRMLPMLLVTFQLAQRLQLPMNTMHRDQAGHGLSNDAVATNSKVWTWGCSEASCTYIYVVDQTSNTSPSGSFDGTITTTQNTGNGTYYLHVQAKDASGNLSAVVHVCFSSIQLHSAPTSVNDALYKNSLTQSTAITWGASTDTNGISRYDYAVGTTAGATDVLTWTAGTSSTSLTISSGLSLTTDTTYFVTVRAVDTAGNIRPPRTAMDGLPTLHCPGCLQA